MKKMMLVCAIISMMGFAGLAHASQARVIDVGVNGMVCDFCAQSLKKLFGKQEAVEKVDISLETKKITVTLKPDMQLSDDTVKKLVVDSGYAVESVSRR
jgi:copper chaperone CopZ